MVSGWPQPVSAAGSGAVLHKADPALDGDALVSVDAQPVTANVRTRMAPSNLMFVTGGRVLLMFG